MDYANQYEHAPQEHYYEPQSFSPMTMPYMDGMNSCTPVDPRLQVYSQPQFQAAWSIHHPTHQIQQYMGEPRTSFFNPGQVHAMQDMNHTAQSIYHLPPASQRRQDSPCSQTLSSCHSNSPPTESDVLPSTPPDCSAISPSIQPKQYTTDWGSQQYQLQSLLGMGSQSTACVNPHEVLSQVMFENEVVPMESSSEQVFDFRTESDGITTAHPSAYPSRQITPMPVIKQEAQVNEQPFQNTYPDPEYETPERSIKVEVSSYEDDDKDLDFKPKASRKRTRNPTAKVPSSSTPEKKRPRVNSNGSSHATRLNPAVPSRGTRILCTECKTQFSDESTYQKHMKQHHTRPFVCVFNYAGCPSTFASKNEWKRHVSSQHLALNYWLCTQDGCSKTTNPPNSRRSSSSSCSVTPTPPALPNGAIFNRKDLYTQHVRRMHVPPNVRKVQKQKKPTPEWDEHLKGLQAEAEQTRCELPRHMRCPAIGCSHEFNGPQAWDERMEHVARHLERAADGKEDVVRFGGKGDLTLTEWASSAQVYVVRKTNTPEGWELINPLKGEVGPSSGNGKPGSGTGYAAPSSSPSLKEIVVAGGSDEDAEGEDEE
ncbi:C2H2 finger domain-containing protein [Colletotrichum karsti]|uniref:C2H2 finger domain-containing protein n=1 Tax=Colletotrichum karsti TaxID=1095194 RepID=A0A9P6IFZ6_9PEZI|nr:C2H2 finger domain-containing protein [Colletotrichum karsti]KAF9882050.1 C2H2 finger domain-containing protein [Colletotrichum karsti]